MEVEELQRALEPAWESARCSVGGSSVVLSVARFGEPEMPAGREVWFCVSGLPGQRGGLGLRRSVWG